MALALRRKKSTCQNLGRRILHSGNNKYFVPEMTDQNFYHSQTLGHEELYNENLVEESQGNQITWRSSVM